jgi:hypothetical protein
LHHPVTNLDTNLFPANLAGRMKQRTFAPGFRISVVDTLIIAGGVGAAIFAPCDLAVIAGTAVGHFFLFCNVFRMSRVPELIWAGAFVCLAAATINFHTPPWPGTVAIAFTLAAILIGREMRQPWYHGIGWQRLNPQLPVWWKAQTERTASPP